MGRAAKRRRCLCRLSVLKGAMAAYRHLTDKPTKPEFVRFLAKRTLANRCSPASICEYAP
jgi:hypothetical protein